MQRDAYCNKLNQCAHNVSQEGQITFIFNINYYHYYCTTLITVLNEEYE